MTISKLSAKPRAAVIFLLAATSLCTSYAQTASTHPVVGTWSWTLFNGQCNEALQYRADGVLLSTSGSAVTVWRHSLSAQPDAQGFYKVVETATRYNSKKDCSGDVVDEEGFEATRFIQLNPAKNQLIVCKTASLEACYGPLKRESLP